MRQLIIFDFDGTLTDAELEVAPFKDGYLKDLAILCAQPFDEIEARAMEIEKEISADPERYGWIFNQQIVAPATVDPYLRMMPVARKRRMTKIPLRGRRQKGIISDLSEGGQ